MSALVEVDSSFFLRHQSARRDSFAVLASYEPDYDFAINGVIWGEVLRGRSDPHVRDRYEATFRVTRMLHLASAGRHRVARLAGELDRRGEVLPLTDLIIGVTALEPGARVLTFDRHFHKIPGLPVVSDLAWLRRRRGAGIRPSRPTGPASRSSRDCSHPSQAPRLAREDSSDSPYPASTDRFPAPLSSPRPSTRGTGGRLRPRGKRERWHGCGGRRERLGRRRGGPAVLPLVHPA